ncbi:HD domain-containing protein [Pseudodesulfovibrio sp. JC047]|uniref:HD-GYP domain-containing protein n=1 Tax=Pseudodesulfovibrio sp. JC047 TaxID=2683199 RepID=UPI0013D0B72B|nr:HD domain-containing phosphohydrolase [Pseudodesulfovibrio sp. JC047]NDV18960.1 HD domain-containing protein [Pseudodesulfovibrio sp. JC047]
MALKENVLGVMEVDCSEGISTEEYNQIDPEILDCFPYQEYPVNLFHWKEDIRVLSPVYVVGRSVDRHLRAKIRDLSKNGLLFFSRHQISQYSECLACNLETALNDPNLTWDEKAGLFICELDRRQAALYAHHLGTYLEDLKQAIESLCDYLLQSPRRIARLVKDVHADLCAERRRINASIIALAIYVELNKGRLSRGTLERVALGFLVYDIGMSHLSPLMLGKSQQFSTSEKRTMREHPNAGVELLKKLHVTQGEVFEPVIQHHERLNGTGYPGKLKGERIGQLGRIAAVADSYCAMITECAYRPSIPPINAAADLVTNERKYDQVICRTLVRFLQTVQK